MRIFSSSRAEEVARRTFIGTTRGERAERWGPLQVERCGLACCDNNRWTRVGNDVLLLLRCAPSGGNKEAWGESKGKGPTHPKDIQGRPQTRLGLWEEDPKSLVAALAKALECWEAAYDS